MRTFRLIFKNCKFAPINLFCLHIFVLSHKAQAECKPICLLHPVMHFLKSKLNSKLGANLQSKSATEKFSWLILIKGSILTLRLPHENDFYILRAWIIAKKIIKSEIRRTLDQICPLTWCSAWTCLKFTHQWYQWAILVWKFP